MNRRYRTFSQRCRGATLIEVLAGLVLLGTIASSALVARGRFLRQWRDADRILIAVRAAEELLAEWLAAPPGAAPVPSQGTIAKSDLVWRTSWVFDPAAQRLGVRKAQLRIVDLQSRRTILEIEFVLRNEVPQTQSTEQR